jgi:hypothetical protein
MSKRAAKNNSELNMEKLGGEASVLARLDTLKTASAAELKAQWRQLFESEPPPYNRRLLESRLAYRIQELAYGGLKPETIARLEALGEQLDGGDAVKRRRPAKDRPVAGTRLIRRGALRHRSHRRVRISG